MSDDVQLFDVLVEIREFLRVLAEPTIALRDAKPRTALRDLVGKSQAKRRAVLIMDGLRSQSEIVATSGIDKSDLSKLVKALRAQNLLSSDDKPRLTISVPQTFFDQE